MLRTRDDVKWAARIIVGQALDATPHGVADFFARLGWKPEHLERVVREVDRRRSRGKTS